MLDPGGLALRNLGRIRKNLRHRSPQSWGGSDRTKFYHPPLPSAGGRRPPIIPPSRKKPMVVAALLEPKFCAQAWWFSHMPGSKCAFRRGETVIFASAPRTWRVAAPLASSGRFLPFSKTKKTLGPFAQKVLRPPAGAPRRPMCVLYCVLQHELASGLRILGFL